MPDEETRWPRKEISCKLKAHFSCLTSKPWVCNQSRTCWRWEWVHFQRSLPPKCSQGRQKQRGVPAGCHSSAIEHLAWLMQAEWHLQELPQPIWCSDFCFVDILRVHWYLVVPADQIHLRKDLGTHHPHSEVQNMGNRILIWDWGEVKVIVVTTGLPLTIGFGHHEQWGGNHSLRIWMSSQHLVRIPLCYGNHMNFHTDICTSTTKL